MLDESITADSIVVDDYALSTPSTAPSGKPRIRAEALGSAEFRHDYGIRYAYLCGAMYKGIASADLVIALGKAGLMGFFGAGGLGLAEIEAALVKIQGELGTRHAYGMNLLCNIERPELEDRTVDLYMKYGVRNIEAAAFMQAAPSIVRFKLLGLSRSATGELQSRHRVLAKISRPEVAQAFLLPAPEAIVKKLLDAGAITHEQAALAKDIPLADDICVEADSGGHTDQGVVYTLLPTIIGMRDREMARLPHAKRVRVGAAGGIGTPQAAAASFTMGADFIMTGSINQCTLEAGTSASVKDLLQTIGAQDTAYAPAGDMFELGARVQVVRKGVFFPARANKLYELYQRYSSIEEIDEPTRKQIQEKYFHRSFDEVWRETRAYYERSDPARLKDIEKNGRRKMALIFKWYFVHTTRLALQGVEDRRVDYQVHCGPALGAFNAWVKDSPLESWRERRVAVLGDHIMRNAAQLLSERFSTMQAASALV